MTVNMTQTEWAPHVSFDDLAPSIVDDELQDGKNGVCLFGGSRNSHYIHAPRHSNQLYSSQHSSNASGEWSSPPSSFQGFGTWKSTLKPRQPPLPETSSMKPTEPASTDKLERWDSTRDYDLETMDWQDERQMERDTDLNTERNSGSRHGYTQAAFLQLHEPEDNVAKPRKKSFAGMSDEDLARLEDFYNSKSRSTKKPTMDKFDFHEQRSLVLDKPPCKNRGVQCAIVDPLALVYPTRPVITHRAISLTTQNADFDEPRRVVSCYISGRRHTWSAADWYVENQSRDGDHLIIVTSISNFENRIMENNASKRNPQLTRSLSATDNGSNPSSSSHGSHSPSYLGIQPRDIHRKAKATCRNILNYYAFRLNHRVIRITVEMVKEDSCKDTITKTMALYKPDLQIVSTVSTNVQIKFKNGKVKLPNFIIRHYSVPTCIVPHEFIDPRLLREDAGTPFAEDRTLSPEKQWLLPPKNLRDRLQQLDQIINRTLVNPFDPKDTEPGYSDASVEEYFPISNEQERKMESFEQLGYVRPKPSRPDMCLDWGVSPDTPNGSCKSSRSPSVVSRSSRLYENSVPAYKVKSLVDLDYDNGDNDDNGDGNRNCPSVEANRNHHRHSKKITRPHLERSKTTTAATKSTSTSDHSIPIVEKGKNIYKKKAMSTQSSPTSPAGNRHSEKKQKGTFGSFFKKMFG
ncbi:hypothetical protein ZYGR_0H01840 [Zygosaccharomyces rouxii]|uniref:Domain X domain-containing protein n=1 Tax=Zygosaccharomyces rouxii TaxID=4956 RepID=A0A1Q2ZVM0_ZYGRO|nr:hypothetical protein ZYGR_0H01840 [Zygosaccharomyces rouxii]